MRRALPPVAADEAVLAFADALIWNWLIAGTDTHAKNYSMLLQGRKICLAPLYDVASGLPYAVHKKKLRFAMKIGGDYRVWGNPGHDTWRAAARELDLDPERLLIRVRELGARIADSFSDAASTEQVRAVESPLPAKLVDLVAKRAARCMGMLEAGHGEVVATRNLAPIDPPRSEPSSL